MGNRGVVWHNSEDDPRSQQLLMSSTEPIQPFLEMHNPERLEADEPSPHTPLGPYDRTGELVSWEHMFLFRKTQSHTTNMIHPTTALILMEDTGRDFIIS